MDAEHDGEGSF